MERLAILDETTSAPSRFAEPDAWLDKEWTLDKIARDFGFGTKANASLWKIALKEEFQRFVAKQLHAAGHSEFLER